MRVHRWPAAQSRRSFLSRVCSVAAATTIYGLFPARALLGQGEVAKQRLIVRSGRPQDLETPAQLLDSWITPNDLFYVRSHFYTPTIDPDAWRLVVDGEVERPLTLTLADLRRLPSATAAVTLECAGNGRAFFDPPVAGVQWEKGAVGTARWTGVRLNDVLRAAGLKPAARHLWLDGGDAGVGRAPDFVRNLPLDKALHPDTVLAYEMNGQTLPVPHGFPLRAIVPGWEGAYSVKWLMHIRVSDREHGGAFVQGGYRYPRRPVAPGATVSAAEMDPLKGMVVKSIITAPAAVASMATGAVRVSGFAWAGEDEIAGVDVSTDNGRTWQPARLGADRARWAWRQFEHTWRPAAPGSYVVMSRARDRRGRMQPIVPDWNPSGYLWNAIDQVRVDVQQGPGVGVATAPESSAVLRDDEPGRKIFESRCLACHDTTLASQQRLTIPGWTREVDKMIGWGAGVTDAEKQSLVEYLAARFGPAR